MSTMTATKIGLEVHCVRDSCAQFAMPLLTQLSKGYDECAVLELRGEADWRIEHRTARKRADRASRRGYVFSSIQRHKRAAEIHVINISTDMRQGRPMTVGYHLPPTTNPLPDYPCDRHAIRTYGVETSDGRLVAYMWVYRSGDLALVSQILGHHDHLEQEIMYLLVQGVVAAESEYAGYLVYNRYDSGTDGLRFFKDRCGFERTQVEWSQW